LTISSTTCYSAGDKEIIFFHKMSNLFKKIVSASLSLLILLSSVTPAFAAMTYSYDANGNMTSDGTSCYIYNEANQLKQVKSCTTNALIEEYLYDANGTRIVKKVYQNGTLSQTLYSPTRNYETKKLADNSTQNSSYYFANDQLVAKKNPDATVTYFHGDQLGSTNLVTNQNGVLLENTFYFPYGEIRSGGTSSKYLFTGQEKDTTGLYYYGARFYNPHLAHFTQPDTLVQNAFDPQSLNRYAYTRNNPLRYADPSGHTTYTPRLLAVGGAMAVGGDTMMFGAFLIPAASIVGGSAVGIQNCLMESGCRSSWNYGQYAAAGAQITLEGSRDMAAELFGLGGYLSIGGSLVKQLTIAKNVNDLAKYREESGLPKAGDPKDKYTTTKLYVDNETVYGKNGKSVTPQVQKINAITPVHGEGQALEIANSRGLIKPGSSGVMFVDRDVCAACGLFQGLRSYVEQLQMKQLDVYAPSGILRITPR
jgi:RHS repeat-associated protein